MKVLLGACIPSVYLRKDQWQQQTVTLSPLSQLVTIASVSTTFKKIFSEKKKRSKSQLENDFWLDFLGYCVDYVNLNVKILTFWKSTAIHSE